MRLKKSKLSMDLPKVGDILTRTMTMGVLQQAEHFIPKECKVIYVNTKHNWYTVEFLDTGIRESYNLPDFDHSILWNLPGWANPVVCLETGYVYRTVTDCANELSLNRHYISRCIVGSLDSYHDYHFCEIL